MSTVNLRFIVHKGVKYLRAEDVAEYLREIAGDRETDTRDHLEQAARALHPIGVDSSAQPLVTKP